MKRNRPLDTRQLMAFELLAETGSFTGAAKSLFLTQSAISHSMKTLEEDLGCKLVRRHGKKISLTDAGQHLLSMTGPILRQMETARDELEGFERYGVGRLRIGASPKSCQFLLPAILRRFMGKYPRCRFEVRNGDSAVCFEMLRSNKIDLAITLEPEKSEDIEFLPWFTDELRIVVTPDHPWVERGWIKKADVHKQNFILQDKKSYTFILIMDYLKSEGMRFSSFVEISDVESIKQMIKGGFGIGILATWAVEKEVQAGELATVRLGRRKLSRIWGVSSPKDRSLSKTELSFARIGEEVGCNWMVHRKV